MTASSALAPSLVETVDNIEHDEGTGERRSVFGASFGFFIDMFDIYLPVVVLAPAIAYFIPAEVPLATRAILTGLIFASTLIARPLGSIIFGWIGDHIGRKKATIASVVGAGVGTALIAFLPGYAQIGMWAVALLILLRFIDGVFLGGEYTGAVPLAMEHSRKRNRGRNSGLIALGFPASFCVISLLTLVVLGFAPIAGPDSAYATWGWRIPFVIGALLSVIFAIYYSRSVDESPVWDKAEAKKTNPLKELFAGTHRRTLLQVFLLMTGVWFSSNATVVVLPTVIGSTTGLSAQSVTFSLVIALAIVAVAYPLYGMLSQKIGRRAFFMWCGAASVVICAPLYVLFASGSITGLWAVTALVTGIMLTGIAAFGAIGAYMCERFPVELRATGYGVGYSVALIIPAFYAFYQAGLSAFMPLQFTPVVLLVVGGLCMFFAAKAGPETKHVDLGKHVSTAQSAQA